MNKNTNVGQLALRAIDSFEAFENERGYKPNREEQLAILKAEGYDKVLPIMAFFDTFRKPTTTNHLEVI
ncbi:hypothetical protein [Leptospira stimsonii]|uniref:HD-GYP domain-containing protein n=1 Tax=Leptospira stimsonii TaxID=2202203 RepID=A0ABY2NF45_9LEPT|nr:hypothetical protein [Leptospira stimsonii]TGK12824.1 hypothetical protein EHO98_19490 [Leptospira stimsonii]TGM22900.1 hypothetical protein EHQ90_00005 [Leptospira stimsonii]